MRIAGERQEIAGCAALHNDDLDGKIFYPLTFPITAGPGTFVVMLILGAHASQNRLTGRITGFSGITTASALLCGAVYISYAYAPGLTSLVAPSTVHGILRVVAFILMCLGVQIAWNGFSLLAAGLPTPH